jgi:catechol 2,3-dioxygenase-like lactoylglutathione lyase family enzyme
MLDHVSLRVSDIDRSRAFYDRVLATLGHRRTMNGQSADRAASGYGPAEPEAAFWIAAKPRRPAPVPPPPAGHHVAFVAPDRAAVDAFHAAALAAGGTDNGPPGLRQHYHADYYAAFVLDPDGHQIEAVCHRTGG